MLKNNKDSRSPLYLMLPLTAMLVLVVILSACGGQNTIAENSPAEGITVDNTGNNGASEEDSGQAEMPEEPAPTEAAADPQPTEEMQSEAPVDAVVSFSAEVFPLLQSRCFNCHGGDRIEGELVMFSYEDLMAGGESGEVIVAGDADNSLLVELVTTKKMPKRGPKLTPVQVQLITDWVNQGAQNN